VLGRGRGRRQSSFPEPIHAFMLANYCSLITTLELHEIVASAQASPAARKVSELNLTEAAMCAAIHRFSDDEQSFVLVLILFVSSPSSSSSSSLGSRGGGVLPIMVTRLQSTMVVGVCEQTRNPSFLVL